MSIVDSLIEKFDSIQKLNFFMKKLIYSSLKKLLFNDEDYLKFF